jgi:small-conductance mechanosensitive channel
MRLSHAVGVPRLLAVSSCLLLLSSLGRAAEAPTEGGTRSEAAVRLHERRVFLFRVGHGSQSAESRAKDASQALSAAVNGQGPKRVELKEEGDSASVLVDASPVLQLWPEDAAAAGDASLSLHAAKAKTSIEDAVHAEVRRLALQALVLRICLAVLLGLVTFVLIRKLSELEGAVEEWLEARPQGAPAVRLGNVELASERAVRGGLHVALRFSKRALQVVLALTWFFVVLSWFDATSDAGRRILGMLLEPVGRVLARVFGAIPQILALAVLGLLLVLVLRSVQLFFGSVARGETHLAWVPADLARPTGTLLQAALVIVTVVFAGPIISGGGSGPFQGLAQAMLIGLAVACTPLFAAVVAGLPLVYGRRLRVGDVAEMGGQIGLVKHVDLLSVVLEDAGGRPVRVPHLLSLFQPMRILGLSALVTVDVTVSGTEDQVRVQTLLTEAAGSHASGARVELRALDAAGALYRIVSGYEDVGLRVAAALKDAGIALAFLGEAGSQR